VLQNVYISLPYNTAARTASMDKNVEITSLSSYLQCCSKDIFTAKLHIQRASTHLEPFDGTVESKLNTSKVNTLK